MNGVSSMLEAYGDRNYKSDSNSESGVLGVLDKVAADKTIETNRGESEITYGEANKLAGDYKGTPAELANEADADSMGMLDQAMMVMLASSNINHFYPLNHAEYRNHHQKAVNLARASYNAKNEEERERLRRGAMLEEGFAAHFLQDCFAAGHMAPRALDPVEETSLIMRLFGGKRTKDWHDKLNEQTEGLPTTEGRFRGDNTMSGADLAHIGALTGESLREVKETLANGVAAPANISLPKPDLGAIRSDPVYGPIWAGMLGDYEDDLLEMEAVDPNHEYVTDGETSSSDVVGDIRKDVYGGK